MYVMRGAGLVLALAALTAPAGGQEQPAAAGDAGKLEIWALVERTQATLLELQRQTPGGREPAASAVISGRVFAADNGVPLRRALVSVQGGGRPVVAQTDFDGRFEVRVPPGRWSLAAAKAGYVTLRLGQRRAFESVPPLEIRAGQRVENANFVLPRGGAIAGRVFDEVGDPVLDARVRVLRYRMVRGRKQLSSAGIAVTTDDRGIYRLYGLAPGQYYVSATAETRPLETGDEQALKYADTYYPGTTDLTAAQRVTVDVGDEQTNVNFSLLPVRTARVSGVVVDASGAPVGPGSVTLTTAFDASGGSVPLGANARIQADGSFELSDVIPGSYTLIARSRGRVRVSVAGSGRRAVEATTRAMAYMPLVVPGDVSDVVVTASSGAVLTGTIATVGGTAPPPGNTRIVAQPLSETVGFGRLAADIADNGTTLAMEGLIGPVVFRADQLPAGWMLDRIEINGKDVTDTYVEFTGIERALARVVLTDEVPEVSGRVVAERPSPSGHQVVIFPADASKWTFPSRYVHAVRSSADGDFTVRALPANDRYFAVALDYLEEDEASDPDFLQAIRSSATSFSLRPGESKMLELKVVQR